MEECRIYLEGLAVTAVRAQLLDDALELNGSEAVSGPRRPHFDLRHKECARFAQRPQRGPQVRRPRRRRSLLRAIAARRGGYGAIGRDGDEPSAAAKAEQAARRGEERGRGHGEWRGGWRLGGH
jgi:hypothetical protein